ncbi:MAG: hypothetical protein H8K07_09595 [Nitrospira sp.]|jgi:hypothetical protein|nr:hypothetical protein [Nitrospira sp.]MDI3462695.1 hypothetical protein [Nitrospira sp.]
MSTPINHLSSGSPYQADAVKTYQQRRQSFDALAQALQSNDLTAAQQAYASLVQNTPAGSIPANSPLAQIGQALQSNDLPTAQNAFATLQAGKHKHHHHHHGNPLPDTSTPGSSQTSTTSETSNKINFAA